jgi:hypothetical protein
MRRFPQEDLVFCVLFSVLVFTKLSSCREMGNHQTRILFGGQSILFGGAMHTFWGLIHTSWGSYPQGTPFLTQRPILVLKGPFPLDRVTANAYFLGEHR